MRTSTLSLINLISLYLKLYLNFLINMLKIFVRNYIKLYNFINVISRILIIFHIEIVLMNNKYFSFNSKSQLYDLIMNLNNILKILKTH